MRTNRKDCPTRFKGTGGKLTIANTDSTNINGANQGGEQYLRIEMAPFHLSGIGLFIPLLFARIGVPLSFLGLLRNIIHYNSLVIPLGPDKQI